MTATVYGPSVSRGFRETMCLYGTQSPDFKKRVGEFAKKIGFASPSAITIKQPEEKAQSNEIFLSSEITEKIEKLGEEYCKNSKTTFVAVNITAELQYTVPFTKAEKKMMEDDTEAFLAAYNELYRIYWEKDKMLKEYGV